MRSRTAARVAHAVRTAAAGAPGRPSLAAAATRGALPLALVLSLVLAAPAAAQMREAGDGVEVAPPRQAQLEEAIEQAPWDLGPFRVLPYLGIRDVSYVRGEAGSAEGTSDLTATAGAGFKAYLPFRSSAVLALYAIPEYNWWQEQSDRNAVVGHYGIGFFGFFNRLQTEVTARRAEEVGFLASDRLVREPVRSDVAAASAQLRLGAAVALFAGAEQSRVRVEETGALRGPEAALLLDRDRQEVRVGLRYLLRGDKGHIGAGALEEETEFAAANARRSSEGASWYAETLLRGNHLDLALAYEQRELEPTPGSAFPGFSEDTGRVVLGLRPGHNFGVTFYALRDLSYSATTVDSFFTEERAGATLRMGLRDVTLAGFYERGEDRYFGAIERSEDVTGYGASVGYMLSRLRLQVGGRTTRFAPTTGPEREVREVLGSVALAFGTPPGEW